VKRKQHSHYHKTKECTSLENILVQIDFAENFACQQQDEIQAAHWMQSQISIFTACIWDGTPQSPHSFVVVSDNITHDKKTVIACLVQVLQAYRTSGAIWKQLTIFSDEPASQMKNKYIFSFLDKLRTFFILRRYSGLFLQPLTERDQWMVLEERKNASYGKLFLHIRLPLL
jgi:hypothetical protein